MTDDSYKLQKSKIMKNDSFEYSYDTDEYDDDGPTNCSTTENFDTDTSVNDNLIVV